MNTTRRGIRVQGEFQENKLNTRRRSWSYGRQATSVWWVRGGRLVPIGPYVPPGLGVRGVRREVAEEEDASSLVLARGDVLALVAGQDVLVPDLRAVAVDEGAVRGVRGRRGRRGGRDDREPRGHRRRGHGRDGLGRGRGRGLAGRDQRVEGLAGRGLGGGRVVLVGAHGDRLGRLATVCVPPAAGGQQEEEAQNAGDDRPPALLWVGGDGRAIGAGWGVPEGSDISTFSSSCASIGGGVKRK